MSNSVRSHYQRRDLQLLFGLQPRAAQKLFELLPRTEVGAAVIVEKNDLAVFLERVRDAADVPRLLDQIRKEKPPITRRKIRATLHTEHVGTSLPDTVYLKRGILEVRFRTVVELAEAMLAIAKIIETPEFERDYTRSQDGIRTPGTDHARFELRSMFEELEKMEAEHQGRPLAADLRAPGGHQMGTII